MSDFSLTLFNVTDEMVGTYVCIVSVYSIEEFDATQCDPKGMKTNNCFQTLKINLTATFHVALGS
jgi:hypothetical protein